MANIPSYKKVENQCKTTCKTVCIKSAKNCSFLIKKLFRVDNSIYSPTFPFFTTNFSTPNFKIRNSYFSTFTHNLLQLLLNNLIERI